MFAFVEVDEKMSPVPQFYPIEVLDATEGLYKYLAKGSLGYVSGVQ